MDRTLLTAEEMVLRYRKEMKNIRMMRWLTLAVYLFLLWRLVSSFTAAIVSVVVFMIAIQFLQSLQTQQFSVLQQVLNQDCDAVKYTEIMELLARDPGKEAATIKLCLAKGQYFSGRFTQARETLDSFYAEKPSVGSALLYRDTSFNCYIAEEDLDGARNERQETEKLLNAVKPNQRGVVNQYLLVMDAALALAEERYEEFFPLQKQVLSELGASLQQAHGLYRLALGELVQGEDADAREHLDQVMELGGTTYMAAEAAGLLEEYALPE